MEYGPFSPSAYRPEARLLRAENMAISASVNAAETRIQYPELARTEAAQYTQGYLHGGNGICWEALTQYQERDRLTPHTYHELADLSRQAMPDIATYAAVDYVNVIHDVFKNTELLTEVGLPRDANHDDALRRLFRPEYRAVRQEHFPALGSGEFNEDQLAIIEGALQGDFIRFVQSQASDAEVEKLAHMPRHILLATIMHGIHDLGGAMGHRQPATSLTLDEPAATRLLDAAHALITPSTELGLPADFPMNAFARQFLYKHLRATRLGIVNNSNQPDLELPTKLKVADLLRCYTAKEFALPLAAFQRLPAILRQSWACTETLPLQYPQIQEPELLALGTEYAPAFLRSFGKDEAGTSQALASFAQIQLHAKSIPVDIAVTSQGEWPTELPYDKINFYHIADALKQDPPTMEHPIWLEYTVENNLLTPRITTSHNRGTYVKPLFHPDAYRTMGKQ